LHTFIPDCVSLPRPAFDPARALRWPRAPSRSRPQALQALAARQGAGFAEPCSHAGCQGRVVVMGMGKSGHVGRKIAATLASTGTPAFFVHPAEASHGDLGMVTRRRRGAGHPTAARATNWPPSCRPSSAWAWCWWR
jgi:hypothetical protein